VLACVDVLMQIDAMKMQRCMALIVDRQLLYLPGEQDGSNPTVLTVTQSRQLLALAYLSRLGFLPTVALRLAEGGVGTPPYRELN
jgi:hypothetical protein